MNDKPEDKSIELTTDYDAHTINMKFSDNLKDDRERGYILSAAFFSFCAAHAQISKQLLKWCLHIMTNLPETMIHHYSGDYKK